MAYDLFTVGYEGRNVDSLISMLNSHAIDCILDVREMPLSRKPGFSKTALQQHLTENHIQYIHFKKLGSPKPLRNRLKETGDYEQFFESIAGYLSEVGDAVNTAYTFVSKNRCCLLCFERQPQFCHRSIVAQKIKERDGNGLRIHHL
jgi:uncharacterized protein (DUF488 family)